MIQFTRVEQYKVMMDMLERLVLEAGWKKFGKWYFCPKCQALHQVYTECSTQQQPGELVFLRQTIGGEVKMTKEELQSILDNHKLWLSDSSTGIRADLRGAELRGADLHEADLRGADLHEADLRGADLRGADLRGTDLHEANLRGANLHGANFSGADLSRADLREADLSKASLRGAILYRANLDNRLIRISCIGSRNDDLTAILLQDNTIQIRTGCFVGTDTEFESAVAKTHGDNEHGVNYRRALAYIRETFSQVRKTIGKDRENGKNS